MKSDRVEHQPRKARAGYLKVPVLAVKALLGLSESPDLLAAYIALRCFAYGDGRCQTAAGAQAIRKATGCTDHRSKKVLRALLADPAGRFLTRTGSKRRNAEVYQLSEWEGGDAYLPAILVTGVNGQPSVLEKLLAWRVPPEERRDALAILIYLYSVVCYGDVLGALPDDFAYCLWRREGFVTAGNDDYELGEVGCIGQWPLWCVSPDLESGWRVPAELYEELFDTTPEDASKRFWRALDALLAEGLICQVAVVTDGPESYPIWVGNKAYAASLGELSIEPGLARIFQAAAARDADLSEATRRLYATALGEDRGAFGTEVYYCAGKDPEVRTLFVPRLHAPTPVNLDGLAELARVTQDWISRLRVRG